MKKTPIIIIVAVLVILGIAALAYSKREKPVKTACVAGDTSDECLAAFIPEFTGSYVMKGKAADSSKLTRTLRLLPGGTLSLESDYHNSKPAVIEIGSWAPADATHAALSITGSPSEQYSVAQTIVLEKKGSHLVATSYDTSLYGSAGLDFAKDESYKNDTPVGTGTAPIPGRDGTDDNDPNIPKPADHGGPVEQPITTGTITLQYGRVTLSPGTFAKFADITIKVVGQVEDSRCPEGVQCIWAGTVNASLDITTSAGTVNKKLTLDQSGSNAVTVGNVTIALVDVKPYPKNPQSSQPISQASYQLTFDVQHK